MKKVKFALTSTLLLMSLIFIPVALGYVGFVILNEIVGVVIGIASFIFIFFLTIAFTSGWESLK